MVNQSPIEASASIAEIGALLDAVSVKLKSELISWPGSSRGVNDPLSVGPVPNVGSMSGDELFLYP